MTNEKSAAALPRPVTTRIGGKVMWNYYATEAEAKIAAEAAKQDAVIRTRQGFDFGFCSPGSITFIEPRGSEYDGLWEVCFP